MSIEVNVTVIHGLDDCYVYDYPTPTVIRLTADYIYFGYQSISGVRFQSVNVPKGATILAAHITLRTWNAQTGDIDDLYIYGEDVDDAAAYSTVGDFNARDRTTEKVLWSPTSWVLDTDYDTPDIKAIVQEIIDREGWAANQAMAFFLQHEGATEDYRTAKSYEDNTTYCARLYIEYHIPVIELAGVSSGVASVSGLAVVTYRLAGITQGVASVSGKWTVWLGGLTAGACSAIGSLPITRGLVGAVSGVCSVTGSLLTVVWLKGVIAGKATVTGVLFHVRKAVRNLLAIRNLPAVRNLPPVR